MSKTPRIVLIDDDETYNIIMQRAAEQAGVRLDTYTSLLDLGSVALIGRYDVAIVDYQLGGMTGVEIAEYVSALFVDLPLILVSQTDVFGAVAAPWPTSIVTFMPKSAGYRRIIETAARFAGRPGPKGPGAAAAAA